MSTTKQNNTTMEIPEDISAQIDEIVKAFNEKRLIAVMVNNPELTLSKDRSKLVEKKIVFRIKLDDGK
jgi:hypothetical protein